MDSPNFYITIDTEADNAWNDPQNIKLENIWAVKRFQELCEKYSIKPTYLIAYECATRDEAIKILKPILDKDSCEIGHHLHTWTTPPYTKPNKSGDIDLNYLHTYQSDLSDDIFYRKANNLKNAIIENYGVKPKSHRAGRWGIDRRSLKWLDDNEFLVDSSIVPFKDYTKDGGPDFRINKKNKEMIGNLKLNEIPVTVSTEINKETLKLISNKLLSSNQLYSKLYNRLSKVKMLRPNPIYEMNFFDMCIEKEIKRGNNNITMMLHSSELALGCSPFSMNQNDLDKVWQQLEYTFKIINKFSIKPKFLREG